jgi:hypothetical protein
MNPLITEAREKGFVYRAVCQTKGDVRVMTSGRIVDYNGNLLVMCQYPFFIRWRGEWVAEVMKKNK